VLTRRVVPCLDVRDGRVVKGVRFEGLRDAGDPAELGRLYAERGADELVFLDVTATRRDEASAAALAERVAREAFIPFTMGGGLRDVDDMRRVLHAGADKVGINTAAVRRPELISEAAARFGSQAVVVAIDAYRVPGAGGAGPDAEAARWRVRVMAGTEDTSIDAVEWAGRAAELGAGEILLTSIDRDGTRDGYDLALVRAVNAAVPVPVIASGGAGRPEHFEQAFRAGASAALAASLFHFRELEIPELKRWLAGRGVPVRPPPTGPASPRDGGEPKMRNDR
jgi:cyclase